MKLSWTPETASESLIDTAKACKAYKDSSDTAELISAMAGGYGVQVMVETWSHGGGITTSIGLATAASHTAGRHVCIVENERAKEEYSDAMQELVGESLVPEVIVAPGDTVAEVMEKLVPWVDFLVVDCRQREYSCKVLRHAKYGNRGAVVIQKNVSAVKGRDNRSVRRWQMNQGGAAADGSGDVNSSDSNKRRRSVVYSRFILIGRGLMMEIAHIAAKGNSGGDSAARSEQGGFGRWIKLVDKKSGEEHVFRR
ncbi:hypothetical protein Droror1_Dr00000793 [Drosera rotundifolia]